MLKFKMMRTFRYSIAAALILLAAVLLAEKAVRIFLPIYDPSGLIYFYYDKNGVPLGRKNSINRQWKNTGDFNVEVRINNYGFRDQKDLAKSTPDDWFIVGDSFGFGMGVEEKERFSDLLEKETGRAFYNISIPGSALKEYEKLIDYAVQKGAHIRHLVLSVCMENDLEDYEHGTEDNSFDLHTRILSKKEWLTAHSALYNLTATQVHRNAVLYTVCKKIGFCIDNYQSIFENPNEEAVLSSTVFHIEQIAKAYDTVVVLVPSRGLWTGKHQAIERQVHNSMVKKLNDANVKTVDLAPFFEQGGDPLSYHFKQDAHWNTKGHAEAAEIIKRFIR